ncbi:hypothetical protein MSG28_009443 [Choristoneura fumiferana]|uniref:Uncharacterized protein n=1 Tax=Choristoneura fumiferana TaxID=7141 RepID=A0ACC0JB72_CHOFU|nr:hypothetical protein MSG28_009443 [Choristoneura fumiferana]
MCQEAEEDLPWNGYVAAAALGALLLLQLAGAALALLAARGPAPARPSTPLSRRAPHAAFSASRVSLVNSFRSGAVAQRCKLVIVWLSVDRSSASSRSGLSVRSVRSDRTPTAEHAPLKAKYKNGRIVPVPV